MRSKGKYQLIIVWTSGEKETHFYHEREFADLARDNMLLVFGNQIEWIGITKKRSSSCDTVNICKCGYVKGSETEC